MLSPIKLLPKLKLNDLQNCCINQLYWIFEGEEERSKQLLEVSADRNDFIELNQNTIDTRSYIYYPFYATNIQYPLKVISVEDDSYFLNSVILKKNEDASTTVLLNNLFKSDTVTESSPGNYNYSIIDFNSKTISRR